MAAAFLPATPASAARLAVVSGASSGIGLAVTQQLSMSGWQVVALGRRAQPPEALAGLAGVRYGAGDLAHEDPLDVLTRTAPDAVQQVHALVSCAGNDLGGGHAFHEHAHDDWRRSLHLNLDATMRLAQACLPTLITREPGDLVLIGSITARRTAARLAAYTAAKHAIRGFAQALRADYADSGLRVTEIAPGVVRSGFASGRQGGDAGSAASFYDRFPQCLEPEDVARAVLWALAQPPHVSVAELVLLPTRERR
jgi:3-hydroxy acid dehydrogenase/malonic semialdehyde reductase